MRDVVFVRSSFVYPPLVVGLSGRRLIMSEKCNEHKKRDD